MRDIVEYVYGLDFLILYPLIALLILGAAEAGGLIGRWHRGPQTNLGDMGTLTGAAIGLFGLLLAFNFSFALARFDVRRTMVLEEANAISSTANFALMLPETDRKPILSLLRDYAAVRAGLGIPYDSARLQHDIDRSLDLQARLWQQAVSATSAAPQSLPAYRFVASLNEVNNIHERRLTALRYHIPAEIRFMLVGVGMVAMGFTGYHAGLNGAHRRVANLIMAATAATLIAGVVDLDRPSRGLIEVPVQPLIDAENGIVS